MSYKAKWYRFPDELPPKEGQYLICDIYKDMQVSFFTKEYLIKRTHEKLTNAFLVSKTAPKGGIPQTRKNICFWTDLPELPEEIDESFTEIEKLKRRIKELQGKIKQFEQED